MSLFRQFDPDATWYDPRKGYWLRPTLSRCFDGGFITFGPVQFNWGYGNGQMPRGFRIHLTWPGRTRSLYLFS